MQGGSVQYPLLTLSEILALALFLFLGIVGIYCLVRIFNKKVKFSVILAAFLSYEFCAVILFLIIDNLSGVGLGSLIIKLVILILASFIAFYLIMRKFKIIDFKKTLLVFLVIIISFPILNFLRSNFLIYVNRTSIIQPESNKLEMQINDALGQGNIFSIMSGDYTPLSLRVIDKIDQATLSPYSKDLKKIIILKNTDS